MYRTIRTEWVDAAKGVGIVLVVLGHVWRGLRSSDIVSDGGLFYALDNAIYLFHMPLFFVISGMFFEKAVTRDGIVKAIWKRIETLLYPLVLWSYITALFLLLAGSMSNRGGLSLSEAALYPFPPKDIYWFLAALFVIQCVGTLIVSARNTWANRLAFALTAFVVFAIDLDGLGVWVRNTIENAPLFFLGVLLGRWQPTRDQGFLGLAAFIAAEAWAVTRSGHISAPADFIPGLIATVGIMAFLATVFSPERKVTKAASALGQASMTIYVSHVIALAAFRIVLLKVGVENPAIHLFFGVIAGIALPYAFHLIATRMRVLRLLGLGRDKRHTAALEATA